MHALEIKTIVYAEGMKGWMSFSQAARLLERAPKKPTQGKQRGVRRRCQGRGAPGGRASGCPQCPTEKGDSEQGGAQAPWGKCHPRGPRHGAIFPGSVIGLVGPSVPAAPSGVGTRGSGLTRVRTHLSLHWKTETANETQDERAENRCGCASDGRPWAPRRRGRRSPEEGRRLGAGVMQCSPVRIGFHA